MPPIEALRAWMLLFVDYIAAKQIIAPALNTMVGGPSKVFESTTSRITGACDGLVKRAIASGYMRPDIDPFDLLRALVLLRIPYFAFIGPPTTDEPVPLHPVLP
jgi:hypothetical protein